MGLVIEICVKYPGSPTRIRVADVRGLDPRPAPLGKHLYLSYIYRTEIKPGKRSDTDTRIKPSPLANGHGRYKTVTCYTRTGTCFRWVMAVTYSRNKYVVTVSLSISLLKRLRNGCFTSETAVRRLQKQNGHLDPERQTPPRRPGSLFAPGAGARRVSSWAA